jgi:hypothetical protein
VALQQPPRITGTPSEQVRAILDWSWKLYNELLTLLNSANSRLSRLEAVDTSVNTITQLTAAISSPPTQAEVTAIRDKVNEIIQKHLLPPLV